MKKLVFLLAFMVMCFSTSAKSTIYLFHGQGSDYRIFSKFKFDKTSFDTVNIIYPKIPRRISLNEYAKLVSYQIDTTKKYYFLGVSFGGMVASELTDLMNPIKTIIVSSAQNKNEVPGRYKFMRVLPFHKLTPAFLYKSGARVAQPIFEPDRKQEKALFVSMLKNKKAYFFKGVTKMMVAWKKENNNPKVIHIHGDNDHTLPIDKCKVDYKIENGSHMMIITRTDEINEIINNEICN